MNIDCTVLVSSTIKTNGYRFLELMRLNTQYWDENFVKWKHRISWHEFVDIKIKLILLLYDNGFIYMPHCVRGKRLLKIMQEIRWMDAAAQLAIT